MFKVLVILLFLADWALAANRYVDSAAPGGGNGQSWATAWNSLGAISGVGAGDIVYISGGTTSKTYNLSSQWLMAGGSSNTNRITYHIGVDAGHTGTAVLNCGGATNRIAPNSNMTFDGEVGGERHIQIVNSGLQVMNRNSLNNLTFRGIEFSGQIIITPAVGLLVENCKWVATNNIDKCFLGQGTTTPQDIIFRNCEFNVYRDINLSGGGDDGLEVNNATVDGCSFYSFPVSGYTRGQHQDFIQISYGWVDIKNNYFQDSIQYAIYLEYRFDGGSSRVCNNVIVNAGAQGIAAGPTGTPRKISNVTIANNTFIDCANSLFFWDAGLPNVTFTNCYAYNNLNNAGSGGNKIGASITQANNVTGFANSGFVSYGGKDFRLAASGTSAINTGTNLTSFGAPFTTDRAGAARPSSGPWDVGAYEFGTTNPTPTPAPTATPTPTATPDPAPTGAVSIWPDNVRPAILDAGAENSLEVGVKFRSDVAGTVTGVRFYKASGNTSPHTGTLWSSSGSKLGTANFSGESGSGWQVVNFANPVSIQANTTYVVSYHTNNGHYSVDENYFANKGVDNLPLHALGPGGNGVFKYGGGTVFPNEVWHNSNYWVDVVFKSGAAPTPTPAPTATPTPVPTATPTPQPTPEPTPEPTPPTPAAHTISEIEGLQEALDGKVDKPGRMNQP